MIVYEKTGKLCKRRNYSIILLIMLAMVLFVTVEYNLDWELKKAV